MVASVDNGSHWPRTVTEDVILTMTVRRQPKRRFAPTEELYQPYSTGEDQQRTNVHYERPVEFFYRITGGDWNVYSCNLWDGATTDTESQEEKLDLLARLMDLRPGQRVLDIGCGWGGPLTYLSRAYGVQGVGLTLSPLQRRAAEARIACHEADVSIVERHWRDYQDERGFDAVFTDEVIVHFCDLGGFFSKVHDLLRPGGRMLNKELHFTHQRYGRMTRAMSFVNEIYGSTGNYRTLAEELRLANEAGFEVQTVHQIPRRHYQQTLERWLANMQAYRAELEAMADADYFRRFRTYLRIVRHVLSGRTMTMDAIVAHKLDRDESGSGKSTDGDPR